MKDTITLVPKSTEELVKDAENEQYKLYMRANSLRNSLERLVNEALVLFNIKKKNTLSQNIDLLQKKLDAEMITKAHSIRCIGNSGSHEALHEKLTEKEILENIYFLNNFCESILATYINNLSNSLEEYPGLFRILSVLLPHHRIKILTNVFNYRGEDIVADKLAMAYVKNNQFRESIAILDKALEKKYITKDSQSFLIGKMKRLNARKDMLPIAKCLEESARNFSAVKQECKQSSANIKWEIETFISIIGWILEDYKDRDWTDEEYALHIRNSLRINFGILQESQ